jgi:hypothetical protein
MSIFFELPMHLRDRWWSANTLEEREAVEAEFHKMKEEAVESKVNVADLYQEALEVIRIPAWPALETKLSSPGSTQVVVRLQAYLDALRAEHEAWKVFSKGGPHSELRKTHKLCWNTLDELRTLVID